MCWISISLAVARLLDARPPAGPPPRPPPRSCQLMCLLPSQGPIVGWPTGREPKICSRATPPRREPLARAAAARHRAAARPGGGAAAPPPGRRAAARPRRAALRAGRGGDAALRRLGHAHAPGPALAGEAAALLLAGRAALRAARRDRDGGAAAVGGGARCSWWAPPRSWARGSTAARAGLHAGFVLGTSVLPFAYGRAASMDMLLAARVTAAMGLVGLRLLGIAGRLAVPAAGVVHRAWPPWPRDRSACCCPRWWRGSYLVAARDRGGCRPAALSRPPRRCSSLVAAPWYVLRLARAGPGASWTSSSSTTTSSASRPRSTAIPGPSYYYVPVVLARARSPGPACASPALARLRPRASRADLFVCAWLAAALRVLLAAGSKLPGYILPCLPPLAILMGRAARDLCDARRRAGAGGRAVALVDRRAGRARRRRALRAARGGRAALARLSSRSRPGRSWRLLRRRARSARDPARGAAPAARRRRRASCCS